MLNTNEIKQRLDYLNPSFIEISDDSHRHLEHIENPTGGLTHATITIVSSQFEGLNLIKRHKLIYSVLNDAMQSSLHALCLKTYTAEEFEKLAS